MNNNPIPYAALSDKVHLQASTLLQEFEILSLLSSLGQYYFAGSYALNVMTWNDIDMQLVIRDDLTPSDALIKILSSLSRKEGFIEGKLIHFTGDYKTKMPRGHYLCVKLNAPSLGGLWKLDFWVLAPDELERSCKLLSQLKAAVTEKSRELILELKYELMGSSGRVPQLGSHWLYQAVLLHGLSEKKAIFDFLRSKGVIIDRLLRN